MLFNDTYKTVEQVADGVYKDKGSKFIAYAYPIGSEADLKKIVQKLRNEHPKANHYCWAMRLSADRSVFKLNDDREPNGTAGRPILNTLLSFDVTNIAVVVVRYFGGALLGIPGLINAYKSATIKALNAAKIVEKIICEVYELKFDYLQMNEVMGVVKDHLLQVISHRFEINCKLTLKIRKTEVNKILDKLDRIKGLKYQFLYMV